MESEKQVSSKVDTVCSNPEYPSWSLDTWSLRIKKIWNICYQEWFLSTSGTRLDKYFHMEMLHRTDPVREGHNSSCLIEQNNLSCQIWQCGLRLWPSHLLHHNYVLINPQHRSTLFISSCSSIAMVVTSYFFYEKEANSPFFNFSYGPRLHITFASKYPNTNEAFWFPSGPYFVKESVSCVCEVTKSTILNSSLLAPINPSSSPQHKPLTTRPFPSRNNC